MAHYAIGDLQGCYTELQNLLQLIDFQHGRDTLWLVGDIVNRGTQSLECLQFCMKHDSSVQIVLGNHDLHLLAIAYGHSKPKRHDTLETILQHKHLNKMRDWLRQQPLLRHTDQYVLVHAGLFPEWTVEQAIELANEVSETLRQQPQHYFANMYGNHPATWSPKWQGIERLRFITNVLTRMRVLNADFSLDFDYKSLYADIPSTQWAWFDAPQRQHLSHTIVFGHWSALGLVQEKQVIALDTGALWGGQLTAVNLATQHISQIQSQSQKNWRKSI